MKSRWWNTLRRLKQGGKPWSRNRPPRNHRHRKVSKENALLWFGDVEGWEKLRNTTIRARKTLQLGKYGKRDLPQTGDRSLASAKIYRVWRRVTAKVKKSEDTASRGALKESLRHGRNDEVVLAGEVSRSAEKTETSSCFKRDSIHSVFQRRAGETSKRTWPRIQRCSCPTQKEQR